LMVSDSARQLSSHRLLLVFACLSVGQLLLQAPTLHACASIIFLPTGALSQRIVSEASSFLTARVEDEELMHIDLAVTPDELSEEEGGDGAAACDGRKFFANALPQRDRQSVLKLT